jgi:hypothetical protein
MSLKFELMYLNPMQITKLSFPNKRIFYNSFNFVLGSKLQWSGLFLYESSKWRLVHYFHDTQNDNLSYQFVNHFLHFLDWQAFECCIADSERILFTGTGGDKPRRYFEIEVRAQGRWFILAYFCGGIHLASDLPVGAAL